MTSTASPSSAFRRWVLDVGRWTFAFLSGRICERKGCRAIGELYILDDYHNQGVEEHFYYCTEHARDGGFCYLCEQFCAGIGSFDMRPNGLCDECDAECQHEDWDREGWDCV